jgi:hypothetical protein
MVQTAKRRMEMIFGFIALGAFMLVILGVFIYRVHAQRVAAPGASETASGSAAFSQ